MNLQENSNITLVKRYFDAVARGDLQTVGDTFSDDIVWHQPGNGSLSGAHKGKAAVFTLLGRMMQRSQGTFRIDEVGPWMAQGALVATPLRFSGQRDGASMRMAGVDLLRIDAGKIQEVWLFSEDQDAEDAFWG